MYLPKRELINKTSKETLLANRTAYIKTVLNDSQYLPGIKSYVVAVLVAHYKNRKSGEFAFTFTDVEARDNMGKYIPSYKFCAMLEDLDLLNSIIDIYGDKEVCDVRRYIDFEEVMNKKCRGGFEIESSGVIFLHLNERQFNAISCIQSISEIEELIREVV